MTTFIMPHLELMTEWHKERQLQTEDAEDDSQIDNDEWKDMELEDDMENMVDMYSFFAYKKLQNSCYSTG